MRKQLRDELQGMVKNLTKANDEIKKNLDDNRLALAADLLIKQQEVAIKLGSLIEESEGEGTITVSYLEGYCEVLFLAHEEITTNQHFNSNNIYKKINKQLIKIENSLKNDIHVRKEAVFLPYKASMWDSMESVWEAANADPDCDAYVIPIPYYDKNRDGSAKEMHYEADLYPKNVPITKYDEYDFRNRRPDYIFIHNPYDECNLVTSVLPFFYSKNIKQFTDCLVYIPYYATTGGMSEGQKMLPAYYYADYIVIQAPILRSYFDERIPDKKFLAFGSPKFDSAIKKCQNPPEIPEDWKQFIYDEEGNKKKVYFYNTSIGGMLSDTEGFLKKMAFVFQTFSARKDVCLLWRPHPLLESTLDSMKPGYKSVYTGLRDAYIRDGVGIFDVTPNIEDSIALSDVYIGDSGTSVTSLFGVAGKPLFILNNAYHSIPTKLDREKAFAFPGFTQTLDGKFHDKYILGPNNDVFYSPEDNYKYKFYCRLSDYTGGGIYNRVYDYEDKLYVFPSNEQHILVIDTDKKISKIELKKECGNNVGVFSGSWIYNDFVFLFPYNYPSLVRFNLKTGEIVYLSGVRDFNVGMVENEKITTTKWYQDGKLYFLNIQGTSLLAIDIETMKVETKDVSIGRPIKSLVYDNNDNNSPVLWLFPFKGTQIIKWNKDTDEKQIIDLKIDGLVSYHRYHKYECDENYFWNATFVDNDIIFAPYWGNKFVKLNKETLEASEWNIELDTSKENTSDFIQNYGIAYFISFLSDKEKNRLYYHKTREVYDIDLRTKELKKFDVEIENESIHGFVKRSESLQYCCDESQFNFLTDLLDNNITGEQFNKEKQLEEFAKVNASIDGKCGEKVYSYLKNRS